MNSYLVLVVLLVWVLGLLAVAKWMPARSPRLQKRKQSKLVLWSAMPICVLGLAAIVMNQHLGRHPLPPEVFVCMALGLASSGLSVLNTSRRQECSEGEARANYANDPAHCGQCEYDLTGNVSGICPECGWRIPDPSNPPKHEVPMTVFSAFGRIDYLDDWRKSLRQAVGSVAMFVVLAVVMVAWVRNPMVAVMAGFMSVVLLVRTARVIVYRRQQAKGQKQEDRTT